MIKDQYDKHEDIDIPTILRSKDLTSEKRGEMRDFLIDLMFKRMTLSSYSEYVENGKVQITNGGIEDN